MKKSYISLLIFVVSFSVVFFGILAVSQAQDYNYFSGVAVIQFEPMPTNIKFIPPRTGGAEGSLEIIGNNGEKAVLNFSFVTDDKLAAIQKLGLTLKPKVFVKDIGEHDVLIISGERSLPLSQSTSPKPEEKNNMSIFDWGK